MYYLISLKHTHPKDEFITLWRSNNSGYCLSGENAGVYETLEPNYHDGYNTLPIKVGILDELFINIDYDGKKHLVPNIPSIWKVLNIKKVKNELRKIEDK